MMYAFYRFCQTVWESGCIISYSHQKYMNILTNIWFVNLFNFIPSVGVMGYLTKFAFPRCLMVWNTFSCAYWPFGWPLWWSVSINILLIFLLGCLPFSWLIRSSFFFIFWMCTDSALNFSQLVLQMSIFDPRRQLGGNARAFRQPKKPHHQGGADDSL